MRILITEDNPGDARFLQEILKDTRGDFIITVAETLGQGMKTLVSQDFDLVLLDLNLPDSSGLPTFADLQNRFPHLPIVIMTGLDDEELAHQAVRLGAQDYLVKGKVNGEVLRRTLLYAIDRKRAETALRHAKEEWEQTFDTVPDLVAILDCQHRIVRVNRAMADRLGMPADQCKGLRCYEAVHGVPEAPGFCPHSLTCKDGKQHVAEVQEPQLGGDFLVSTTPLFDPRGKLIGAVHVARDITKRKAAEQKLQQRTLELQLLTETLEQRVLERTTALEKANELLEQDIAERKQAEEQLKESEKKLRYLSSELLTAQEKERKRIASELHDSIAASLSAVKFSIEKTLNHVEKDERTQTELTDLVSQVRRAIEETRRIMSDLRPSMLDDLGIVPALGWFCREFQKTYSHIRVDKQIGLSESDVMDSLRTPMFRLCQEALNNVAKHSRATSATLCLKKGNGAIEVTIQDNGQGFDLSAVKRGLGLSTMRERTELSGGSFSIESATGTGTVIRCSWPL